MCLAYTMRVSSICPLTAECGARPSEKLMPFTRRTFLSLGGSGLAAGSLLASLRCSRTTSAPGNAAATPTWEARIADIEKRLRQSMHARQVPGVSIAVIRDARIAWTGHFGVRNRTTGVPVDDATVFSG